MDTTLAIAALFASVASLALAVVAIWISLYGKSELDKTNLKTQDLLTEIRSDAKSISQYAIPELRAYGDSVRHFVFEKGESNVSSTTSMIEQTLSDNMRRIDKQIEAIRSETDLSKISNRLDELENQLQGSQDELRKSVQESFSGVTIRRWDGSWVTVPYLDDARFALTSIIKDIGLSMSQYGKEWMLRNRLTQENIPVEALDSKSLNLPLGSEIEIVQ
ncbi:hypothetical protein ACFL5M_03090 [Candidatus Neomarinimicrobiota bacterium]